jgi:hypothetical protein
VTTTMGLHVTTTEGATCDYDCGGYSVDYDCGTCWGPAVEEKLAGGTCLERVWSMQTGTCGLDQRLHCYR